MLRNLPTLWSHPGVSDRQRRELVQETFDEVRMKEHNLLAVKPKPAYAPLFAYCLMRQKLMGGVGVTGVKSTSLPSVQGAWLNRETVPETSEAWIRMALIHLMLRKLNPT